MREGRGPRGSRPVREAAAPGDGRSARWVAQGSAALLAAAWSFAAGCGQPNPKILESSEHARGGVAPTVDDKHSEPAKIRQLIALVRASEHTFVINGLSRSGPAAAERLQ